MKPIKLKLTAFGPYKNEETIDFGELGEHRLFVISGMTGAGKTTIFDGISFALYGSGSGQDRKDTKSLRSDFADDAIHTSAELTFQMHGHTYRVLRQLPHVRKGNKSATGDKYELYELLEDGTEKPVVERMKVREVDKKIEQIIGLSQDQFSQIVMLPQGEFRKLLTSETENKEEILRKIFKTDRYGEVIKKLDAKRRNAELEMAQAEAMRQSYIGQISGALPVRQSRLFEVVQNNGVNMYQLLEALDEETKYYEEQIGELQKIYDEAYEEHGKKQVAYIKAQEKNAQLLEHEKRKEQLALLEAQRPIFEAQKAELESADRASRLDPFEKQLFSLRKEFKVKEEALVEMRQALERASEGKKITASQFENEQKKAPERELASERILQLKGYLPVFEELEKSRRLVTQLSSEVSHARAEMEQIVLQREANASKLRATLKTIEEGEAKLVEFDVLSTQLDGLREKMKVFKELEKHLPNVRKLEIDIKNANRDKEQAEESYRAEERKWITNQASVLASKLMEGEACPVCGSMTHERTHSLSNEMVDEALLERLKQVAIASEKRYIELYGELTAATQYEKRLLATLEALGSSTEQYEEVNKEYTQIGQHVHRLKQVKEDVASLKLQWKNEQQALEKLQQTSQGFEQDYREKYEQLVQQQAILEEKNRIVAYQFESLQHLQEEIKLAQAIKEQLEQEWEMAQKQYNEANQQFSKCELQVEHGQTTLQELGQKLEEAAHQFKEQLNAAQFTTFELYTAAKRSEQHREKLSNACTQYTQSVHVLQSKLQEDLVKLAGVIWQDLTEAGQRLEALKNAYEDAYRILNQSKEYAKVGKDFYLKLEVAGKKIAELEGKASSIIELYNVLRGQNERKISFERYVQIGYLEQITAAANRRLKYLSDGQYSLHCSDRQEAHGRQSGLSLDVLDDFTGQMRDVKTLSGGEKFNASLCLALGMADVIQSFQGNIRIDTMFIDEGFGSLDQESLLKAIDTLIDLQKSGRMIGIISHVEELKNAMPATLEVIKAKEGFSKTQFVLK